MSLVSMSALAASVAMLSGCGQVLGLENAVGVDADPDAPRSETADAKREETPDAPIDAAKNETPDAAPDAAPDAKPAPPPVIRFSGSTSTAFRGTDNGTLFDDVCPEGQALIGFSGLANGSAHADGFHSLQARCGVVKVVDANGTFRVTVTAGVIHPRRGADGDFGGTDRICPNNELIIGFGGALGSVSGVVDALQFRCAPLVVSKQSDTATVTLGPSRDLERLNGRGNGGPSFAQTNCPAGQVATMSRIRADRFSGVPSFALSCGIPAAK